MRMRTVLKKKKESGGWLVVDMVNYEKKFFENEDAAIDYMAEQILSMLKKFCRGRSANVTLVIAEELEES